MSGATRARAVRRLAIVAAVEAGCGPAPQSAPAPPRAPLPAVAPAAPGVPGAGLASLRPYSLAISVADLDASVAWYRDKLGFRQEVRTPIGGTLSGRGISGAQVEVAIVERNGFRIEMLDRPGSADYAPLEARMPDHNLVQGVKNVVLAVDDLAAANAELRARGVPLLWESVRFDEMGTLVTMIRDNDGNLISLWQTDRAPPTASR